MAVIQNSTSADQVTLDPTFKASHVVLKPDELTGAYQLSAQSGALTTIAAAGRIFSFRWAPGTGQLCVIKRVSISFVCTTAFTAAQQMGYGLYVARSFTASDTVGTQVAPFSTNFNKYRTTQTSSNVTDARIGIAAVTSGGTINTTDTNALGLVNFWVPGAGTSLPTTNLISYNASDYPLVLQNNEGFVIQNTILMGATGVGTAIVNVEWFETNSY
jgi:hypothetical protein